MQLVEPLSTNDLLACAVQSFADLLPEGWETSLKPASDDPYIDRRLAPDALLEVTSPDGSGVAFAVAARLVLGGRETAAVLARLERWREQHDSPPLVVARYLSSTVRESIADAGHSWIDATGNVRVSSAAPAVALMRQGLDRDPWRRSRIRDNLRGEPAARVVRALCDFTTPMQVAQLIELAGASAGATYRVIDLLVEEGLVEKQRRGTIDSADWQPLLRRWALDHRSEEDRFTRPFESDDDRRLLKRLAGEPEDSYVLGGRHAAATLTGRDEAGAALLIHCDDHAALAKRLGLRAAGRSGHGAVQLHTRRRAAAAAGSIRRGGLTLAAPSQAYADLVLLDDKRADDLLRAMRKRPAEWRRTP
jgi:hypothetical protein